MNDVSVTTIRRLGPADTAALQSLRLESLLRHPEAFGSDFALEAQMAPEVFAKLFLPAAPGGMFGAFAGPTLVGMTALGVPAPANQRHKGRIFAVYVQPLHRKHRVASQLLDAVIAQARAARLVLITLSVTVGNAAARRLYVSYGFTPVGIVRRSTRVGSQFYDEEFMTLDLDQP